VLTHTGITRVRQKRHGVVATARIHGTERTFRVKNSSLPQADGPIPTPSPLSAPA